MPGQRSVGERTASVTAQLLALQDTVQPSEIWLGNEAYTLGRAPSCQIVVPGQLVSRMHARIEPSGPRFLLRDAGSVNGTFVNGRIISEPHLLVDGDLIGLGTNAPSLRFIDPDPTIHASGRLRYDERAMLFQLHGQPLDLTPAQFRLLYLLYTHAGEVCSREQCAAAIWSRDYEPGRDAGALDQALNGLRRVFRLIDPNADMVQTRRGLGYVLVM